MHVLRQLACQWPIYKLSRRSCNLCLSVCFNVHKPRIQCQTGELPQIKPLKLQSLGRKCLQSIYNHSLDCRQPIIAQESSVSQEGSCSILQNLLLGILILVLLIFCKDPVGLGFGVCSREEAGGFVLRIAVAEDLSSDVLVLRVIELALQSSNLWGCQPPVDRTLLHRNVMAILKTQAGRQWLTNQQETEAGAELKRSILNDSSWRMLAITQLQGRSPLC